MATFSRNAYAKIAYRLFNFVVFISLCLSNMAFPKATASAAYLQPEENPSTINEDSTSKYTPPKFTHPIPRQATQSKNIDSSAEKQSSNTDSIGGIPVMFIENIGQSKTQERFVVNGSNGIMQISPGSIDITVSEPAPSPMIYHDFNQTEPPVASPTPSPDSVEKKDKKVANVRLSFDGANSDASIVGFNRLDTKVSIYKGNNPDNWRSDVPAWGGIRYLNIYDGIDLELTSDNGQWIWRFSKNITNKKDSDYFPDVKPESSSDLSSGNKELRLKIEGSDQISLVGNNINISTELGNIQLPLPEKTFTDTFNESNTGQPSKDAHIENNEIILPFSFPSNSNNNENKLSPSSKDIQPDIILGENKKTHGAIHFASPAPLSTENEKIINYIPQDQDYNEIPFFSTYLGATLRNVVVDSAGNSILLGPVTIGDNIDLGVYKLNASGSDLISFNSYGGSETDFHWDCTVDIDASDNIYILGNTLSDDFSVSTNAFDKVFEGAGEAYIIDVSTGYVSYLGGKSYDIGHGIAVGSASEVYVTGMTASDDFPIEGGFDSVFEGGQEAFLSIINTSGSGGLTYSTYIGGDEADQGHGIAVQDGFVYLTGQTHSDDFPASGSNGGSWDSFVLKFDPSSNNFVYSKYFGGSSDDCERVGDFRECAIAVSKSGDAYITGMTYSSDFPSLHAYDTSTDGSDAYLARFSASGDLIFSTYVGGSSGDAGFGIVVNDFGVVYLTGSTASSNFPTTTNGYDRSISGIDVFLAIFGPEGYPPIYSTFLGGNLTDIGYDLAINENDMVYLTGETDSSNFPHSTNAYLSSCGGNCGFVTDFYLPDMTAIAMDQINEKCEQPLECPNGNAVNSTGNFGDPINTSTGQFFYNNQDISIPLPSQSLIFARSYSAFTTDMFTSTMGYGWTHSLDTRLILPNDPLGIEGFIRFKAHSTNIYDFLRKDDGSYEPMPGVVGVLTYTSTIPYTYTLVMPSQITYTFDHDGILHMIENSIGQKTIYTYNQNDQLTRVADENNERFLDLSYNGEGFVSNVADHTSREITFTYNITDDLVSYVDVLGQTWQYEYDSNHNLTKIIDPDNNTVTETEYDSYGRAIKQWDGLGNQIVDITFNSNGTVTLENPLSNIQTHIYNGRGTLIGDVIGTGITTTKEYDKNFKPISIIDPAGQETQLEWSEDGVNLTNIEDAAGNQTEITYDSINNPTEVVDALDHVTTYDYDGKLLTHTTDALGEVITYTYTDEGYLQSITNPLTQTTTYSYDEFGQRTSITNTLGIATTYEFDDLGRVINTTDALGRVTHTDYDAAGRIVKSIRNYDPLRPQNDENQYNIVTTYAYDVRGNQIAVTDTYTHTTQYIYNDAGLLVNTIDPIGNIITNTYNEAGQLITVTNALGSQTSHEYDEAGRQTAVTDALSNTISTIYNLDGTIANTINPLGHMITYTYDSLDRLIATTDELNGVTLSEYDAAGNIITSTNALDDATTYEYNALGRLIKQTDALEGVTEYFYDEVGNRIQTIDPCGHATTYTYDDANRLVKVTDALGNETEYEYDELGRQIAVIDADDNRTEYTYDALDRVIAVTDPLSRTTTTQYDALGNVLSVIDANNNTTTYEYDDLYRQIKQTDALNGDTSYTYDALGNRLTSTDAISHTTTYQYDALGRNISVTDPLSNTTTTDYDAAGQVISTTNALGKVTSYEYDALGRQISMTDPNGSETEQSYDAAGNLVSITDANDVVTHYEYDSLGRLTAVIENYKPGYNPDYQTNVRTEYTYDENGNRLSIEDANEHVTAFTYDDLNRVIDESDPLDNTWTYTYNAMGRRATMTDANDVTVTYNYDDAGQLIGIDYPGTASDITFTYDLAGRRTQMVDALGATAWDYDDLNRPTAITDPFNHTVEYGYDAVGNRTNLTYPDAKTVTYSYNSVNQLTNVTDWDEQMTQYSYDPVGRLLSILRPNGVDSSYSYNDGGQLTQLQHAYESTELATFQYNYDAVGNRTSVTENYKNPDTNDISDDQFESGDISGWNASSVDEGDLSVTSSASIESNYGLQAVIDDDSDLWVEDDNLRSEAHYRVRFYFDPNSISMPSGSSMDLFYGKDAELETVVYLQLRSVYGETQIRLSTLDDTEQLKSSRWFPLTNEAHAIELDWQAASSSNSNDGHCTFWIDGLEKSQMEDIDSDNQRIDSIQLGVFNFSTSQIAGTVYFDDFISKRFSYIGLNPNIQVPEIPENIYSNGWENGNFIGWSSVITDSGSLIVSTNAALEGSYGMMASINDNHDLYVIDESPLSDIEYHARFYLDPNSIDIPTNEFFDIVKVYDDNTGTAFRVRLSSRYGEYQLKIIASDDNQQTTESDWIGFSNNPHAIEVEWDKATATTNHDGLLKLWIDNEEKASITNLDSDLIYIDAINLGVISPSTSNINGAIYFDDFDSDRSNHLGLNSIIPVPQLPNGIFSDSFENGNYSNWSTVITDSGDLSVTSGGAVYGNYGLQATIDDDNELFVLDESPLDDDIYHVRFYFDPNSINIPIGSNFYLFKAFNIYTGDIFSLQLRFVNDEYQIRVETKDDNQQIFYSSWIDISDKWYAFEFEWHSSSSSSNNDGYLNFWIDGEEVNQITNLDSFTKKVDCVKLGILSPSTSDISGTPKFDEFVSNRSNYIGLNPNLPTTGQIFSDAFENGDFINWGDVVTDSGDLSVTSMITIEGNLSLQGNINDDHDLYVQDKNPLKESNYHARFYFDPYSANIPAGEYLNIFKATNKDTGTAFTIQLRSNNGRYQVQAVSENDNQQTLATGYGFIHDGINAIEVQWVKATEPQANNGTLRLWTNDNNMYEINGLDTDTKSIDTINLGVLSLSSSTITGTIFFDDFVSNSTGYIGQNSEVALPLPSEILADHFETGEFARWDEVVSDNGDLSVSTQAAIEGNYGLQAVINDDDELYLTDLNPSGGNQYFTLFYFDPNSINIPTGEMVNIYQVKDDTDAIALTLQLRAIYGEYQIRASAADDNQQTTYTRWVALSDEPHGIELIWRTADEPGANNGNLNIILDDIEKWSIINLDNDTIHVDTAQLGVISPTTSIISGTIFFDDFGSDDSGYISLNYNIPIPEQQYFIFDDNFESGDFSAWTDVVTDSGDLSITSQNAIEGTYHMQSVINDQNELYVYDESPLGNNIYEERFYFNTNSVNIPEDEFIDIFHANDTTNGLAYRVRLQSVNDQYQVGVEVEDDNQQNIESSWYDISDDRHAIEIEFGTSSGRDENNGFIRIWLDNGFQEEISGLDNYTKHVDYIQMGVLSPTASTISGSLFFDCFYSKRDGYIGLNPNVNPSGYIYSNAFENGSFSAWSEVITDSGDLSITSTAAKEGTYGMQAVVDDDNDIWVKDNLPNNEVVYHKRFYFDPNSVYLPVNSSMNIFQASDSNDESVYSIKIRSSLGNEYQLQIFVLDDSDEWIPSLWIPITDETHAIEVQWQAATEPNANNGETKLWIDGNQKYQLSGIDNDEKSIDYIQMGVLSPTTSTITGTVFFDDFDSNNTAYIGLNSNIQAPENPGVIFSDAFETANFSAWTDVITDANDLIVTTTAAIEGSYGMLANIDDDNAIYVLDSSPLGDTSYHARFYVDTNSISIPSEEYIDLLQSVDMTSSLVNYVRLRSVDGQYQIQAGLEDDNQQTYSTSWFDIIDDHHAIEIEWQSSSGLNTNNGHLRLWIDDEERANMGDLDVYTKRIDAIKIGALSISDPAITGTFSIDDFDSNRTGHIGLNPIIPPPGQIFANAFESGNFTAWSSVVTDTGDLSISSIGQIEGSYFLKAIIDDGNNLYVMDDNPNAENEYHARFYFDPYSVKIPIGEYINLFQGIDTNTNTAFFLRLQESDDHFQVQVIAVDDNQQNYASDWLTIHNGINLIELKWSTASEPYADNGYLNLWINENYYYEILSLDTDSKLIDSIEMGVISPSTSTITGAIFFDDFVSNGFNYIGQNNEVSLPYNSEIFGDHFESGEFVRWDKAVSGNGDLSVSTLAAILGNYGLQAVINDDVEMYLTDLNPDGSNQYFTLFYFDPNSVSIPSGETVNIYQVKDDTGALALTLQLRQVYGEYQVRASALDDNQQITYTRWVALSDEAHAIELFWRTADEPGANNGNSNIAVDDEEKWVIYPLDNDTIHVDIAQLGVISPTTSAISGTIFFDDFGTDNSGYITLNPNFPIPELPYDIFEDDFESGDFSAWSTVITDTGDLIVTSTGAIEGNYGMQAVINDQNELYVYDESPWGNTFYQVRFYFDPNSVAIPQDEYLDIFHANDATTGLGYRVRLRLVNGQYQVAAAAEDDSTQIIETSYYDIDDAPVSIQLEYATASDWDSYDGHFKLWLDDELQEEVFDIDNFTKRVDYIQLGVLSPSTTTITGTVYFDDLDSNRSGYIGYQPQNRILASFDLRQWLHKAGEFISTVFDFFRPMQAAQSSNEKAQTSPQSSETLSENQEAVQPAQLSSLSGKSVLANYLLTDKPNTTLSTPLATLEEPELITVTQTITYTYDPLNRLTAADYSDDTYYHYTYDAVGNRLTQVTASSSISYTYDIANRLTNTNGITYTWDANGNLLSDGVNTYTYDLANRLTAFNNGTNTTTYAYNGLGDRLQQTANSATTTYAVDITGGLTQVLSDGTNTYLYGAGRIAQKHNSITEYYLADALGSVRQLTDSDGEVVLARSYAPYGSLMDNTAYAGVATAYGYTGEYTDVNGMVNLRARYYSPAQGRFVSRDVWEGYFSKPLSLNRWNYVESNPINFLDPSGYISQDEATQAEYILNELYTKYNIFINKDWGEYYYEIDPVNSVYGEATGIYCWNEGMWDIRNLEDVRKAVNKIAPETMSINKFNKAFQHVRISRINLNRTSFAPPGGFADLLGDIVLTDYTMGNDREEYRIGSIIHEFGHVWDYRSNNQLAMGLMLELDTWVCTGTNPKSQFCNWEPLKAIDTAPDYVSTCHPGTPTSDPYYDQNGDGLCDMPYSGTYGGFPPLTGPGAEDWAQSFVYYIYPEYKFYWFNTRGLKSEDIRYKYVQKQIKNIH